jgi:hypothetical protein
MAAKKKKKTKKAARPAKAGASARAGATKKKKAPAKKSKKAVKTSARKTKAKKSKKAPAKKAKKKTPAKKQQVVGEGDYVATRRFDSDQAAFVAKNRADIPAMGKDAEKALDGPEGDSLRDAEATAAARSRDNF